MMLLFLLFLVFLSIPVNAQDYRFTSFSSDKELLQPYVYAILQDANGYLWLGTGNGLSRYNGKEFSHFTEKDSLAENFIRCGYSKGNELWFGHMNGNVSWYHNNKFNKVISGSTNPGPVTHFAAAPSGSTWYSNYSGSLTCVKSGKIIHTLSFPEIQSVTCFEFMDEDNILLGTEEGLFQASTAQLPKVNRILEIPSSRISGIILKHDGKGYFIATENEGLFEIDKRNGRFQVKRLNVIDIYGIENILQDDRGYLWVATLGSGVIKIDLQHGNHPVFLNKRTGYPTDNVKTLFEDREGLIWTGNYGEGLTQILPRPFAMRRFDEKYGNNVTALWLSRPVCWVGTDKGLIKTNCESGEILEFFKMDPGSSITSIFSNDGKTFWIGTFTEGVYTFTENDRKFIPFILDQDIPGNAITGIAGNNEHVWIGTRKGLCQVTVSSGEKKWFTINQGGLPHNFVNSLYADMDGSVWISTNSSILARLKNDRIEKVLMGTAGGIFTLSQVTRDASGRIWAATFGNGLLMVNHDSVLNFNSRLGLFSDYSYSLVSDGKDHLWTGHRGGISRIRTSDFTLAPMHDPENLSDECQFNRNANAADSSMVMFGSDQGLYVYNSASELIRRNAPALNIVSLKVNDEEKNPSTRHIHLPPGSYKIRIEFLGISLKDPSLVTYQYKLDGYDQWSDITKDNVVTYYKLTGGTYRFILKAANGDGDVTMKPLAIEIIIQKPIWKKWWFILAVIVVLLLLVGLVFRWRLYRLTLERNLLEEKVHKRTYEIECQKNEIALQRDLIEKKSASITSSILYASQIQNAILPPDELIDKLLPQNFVLTLPKDIVSGDFYWIANKDNKVIVTVADCTGHGVPGSFMSLLGITLINEIVNILGITEPDEILNNLRDKVIGSLQQNRKISTTADGMDIALCVIDFEQKTIDYSGGMNDLVLIHNGEMQIINADRLSVSAMYTDSGRFTKKQVRFSKGDMIYLFSDGFMDQFGGPRDKKFLRHRFNDLLLEVHSMPPDQQKKILCRRLYDWMGSNLQTDDITVMGVRF